MYPIPIPNFKEGEDVPDVTTPILVHQGIDFFIFENSRRYSKDEFIEFVKTFDIVSSERKFEDVVIDTDNNTAHISLKQFGEFIVNTPDGKAKLEFEWLESTYAVKIDNKLKFKFYFSEAIKTNTTILESETIN
jgi:hypothetical protein